MVDVLAAIRGGRRVALRLVRRARPFLLHPLLVPVLVFIVFELAHIGLSGPAYLSDEIGYLDKAAFIAGSPIHQSSSWYAGYSLLITPAFLLSHNPFVEWQLITGLNALMWAVSAWLLYKLLRQLRPETGLGAIQIATFGAMAYPAWITMSGYSFSTPGFVVVFMAALVALTKSQLTRPGWLITSAVLTGFLAWIHPTGYLVALLLALLFVIKAASEHRFRYLSLSVTVLVMSGLGYLYNTVINHLIGSSSSDHAYAAQVNATFGGITHGSFWLQTLGVGLGVAASVLIATFGVAFYGSLASYRRAFTRRGWREILGRAPVLCELLAVGALLVVVIFTAVASGDVDTLRPDQWVYLRYSDMVLLPVLGLGLLSVWRAQTGAVLAVIVTGIGGLLNFVITPGRSSSGYVNHVNIEGFYPAFLPGLANISPYLIWSIIGALGIAVVAAFGRGKWRRWLIVLILPILAIDAGNYIFHARTLTTYSHPGTLYQIAETYPSGTCIGFSPGDAYERFNLYSFYLHTDNLQPEPLSDWLASDCGGLYVATSFDQAVYPQLKVVGYEQIGNLVIVARH